MRYNTYDNGGAVEGLVSISGMNATGYVILKGDPIGPLEAASRQYVLFKASSIKASSIVSGVLNKNRLPEFSGAANIVAANNVISLSDSGVLPGTYTKVTVNSAGIVTSASNLVSSDIPPINWNKIVSGKPTTLDGYGITNGVNRNTGIVTGNITLNGATMDDDDAASKVYVDSKGGAGDIYNVGDLVKGEFITVPTGLLRCNGGEVSKTTYSALYAMIGDKFGSELRKGSGKPWKQQYGFNEELASDLDLWTTETNLPTGIAHSQAVLTKNRVYLIGGANAGGRLSSVYTAPIESDGTLGAWSLAASLPGVRGSAQLVVTKDRIYLFGGTNSAGNATSIVYTASINPDGTLGAWTSTTPLPGALEFSQAIITKNKIYLLGGNTTGYVTTVYTASVNEVNGVIGAWSVGTPLPVGLARSQVITTKDRIYLLGGLGASGYSSVIYTAVVNADGSLGSWVSAGNLPVQVAGSQAIVIKDKVYLLGGALSGGYSNLVYSAPINADGTLGTWSTSVNTLPGTIGYSQAIVTSSKVYLLGGYIGSYLNTVYSSDFNGGSNDYSPYYDGTSGTVTAPDKFRLPNYTTFENNSGGIYIKY